MHDGRLCLAGLARGTHIARRTCERQILKSGRTSRAIRYGITNLPERETSAALLEQLWRGIGRLKAVRTMYAMWS